MRAKEIEIEVEKGVPIPNGRYRPDKPQYPILDMEEGDSFFIECKRSEMAKLRGRINSCINIHRSKIRGAAKFTIKVVEGGLRTWRVQ